MPNSSRPRDQREELRINLELPAQISIGSQLTIQGQLKDLSLKSAFIRIKSSIFMAVNDEVGFAIQASSNNAEDLVQGLARVSRIVPGEGIAIYFTKMDDAAATRLKAIFQGGPPPSRG
jgi:hypothetical protein